MTSIAGRLTSKSPIIPGNMNMRSCNNNILRQAKQFTGVYESIEGASNTKTLWWSQNENNFLASWFM